MRERAELAARRDGAKERRELLLLEMRSGSGGTAGGAAAGGAAAAAHEAELREIDDEAESLEAQLEVKSARTNPNPDPTPTPTPTPHQDGQLTAQLQHYLPTYWFNSLALLHKHAHILIQLDLRGLLPLEQE